MTGPLVEQVALVGSGVTFGTVLVVFALVWIAGQRFIDRGWNR